MALFIPPNMLDLEGIEDNDGLVTANSIKVIADVLNQIAARPNRFRAVANGTEDGSETVDGNVFLGTFTHAGIAPAAGMRARIPGRTEEWILAASFIDSLNQFAIFDVTNQQLVWSTIESPSSDAYDYLLGPPNGRTWTVALGSEADDDYRWDLVAGDTVYAENAFRERNRTVGMGEWTTQAFAAGDYTASGSMTWTVAAGDVVTNAYTLIGKTMIWSLVLQNTTVGGTASTELRVTIPGGFTSAKVMEAGNSAIDDAVTDTPTRFRVEAGTTVMKIFRVDGGNWDDTSTDATHIRGQITFEIQ